ncbi:MAG TPA: OmpA family protein [Steroidobacteraceae bacterium]|nr:OmpA family protein [Steroidobacteraceae bacterium]
MKSLMTLAALLAVSTTVFAAVTVVPTADVAGAKDPAYLGRFAGAKALTYTATDFDSLTLPLSALAAVPGQRDGRNNQVFAPVKKLELEGRRTHLVYLLPDGTAPLAAIRNYQNATTAKGGRSLFECKDTECGGGQNMSTGGGGRQSLAMYIWPKEKITDKMYSGAQCALSQRITEQRFTALEVPAAKAHVAVLAFTSKADGECKNFNGRTFVMVDTLETKAMAQTMDSPTADEMVAAITTSGRVALYGILFDSSKAEVKPESKDTMAEIGKLLAANKTLRLLVVGHTDNVGGFPANLELSKKRADAVVTQLISQYKVDAKRLQAFGVAYASPVASNVEEAGRARNRRVELVANN